MNKKGVISSRNKLYWINKGYSEEESIKMARSRMPGTLEYYIIYKKLDPDTAKIKSAEFQQKRAITLKNLISKYGEYEGTLKWEKYRNKQSYTNSWEYFKNKGYTYKQFLELNKKRGLPGKLNPMYKTSYYEVWVKKYGKEKADEMNAYISIKKAEGGKKQKNIPKTVEAKKHMSISAKKRVKLQGFPIANFNENACIIIDNYGNKNGYKFQHAKNGGEFHVPNTQYVVDGYDREKNTVIEYDEKRHYKNDKLLEEDIVRQNIIVDKLKCKFIRIKFDGTIQIYEN